MTAHSLILPEPTAEAPHDTPSAVQSVDSEAAAPGTPRAPIGSQTSVFPSGRPSGDVDGARASESPRKGSPGPFPGILSGLAGPSHGPTTLLDRCAEESLQIQVSFF